MESRNLSFPADICQDIEKLMPFRHLQNWIMLLTQRQLRSRLQSPPIVVFADISSFPGSSLNIGASGDLNPSEFPTVTYEGNASGVRARTHRASYISEAMMDSKKASRRLELDALDVRNSNEGTSIVNYHTCTRQPIISRHQSSITQFYQSWAMVHTKLASIYRYQNVAD